MVQGSREPNAKRKADKANKVCSMGRPLCQSHRSLLELPTGLAGQQHRASDTMQAVGASTKKTSLLGARASADELVELQLLQRRRTRILEDDYDDEDDLMKEAGADEEEEEVQQASRVAKVATWGTCTAATRPLPWLP
jgi:hypothetical protein